MSTISVIIPCYNDGIYLDDSVGSILGQTFTDWELIIVNDGSTDAYTIQKLKSYNNPKIRILHKENGKMSSAKNYGIKNSKTNIIATLDADDIFDKKFLATAFEILQKNNTLGAVSCYLKSFGLKKMTWKPLGGNIHNYLYRFENCSSCMFQKKLWETVGGFDEKMILGYEDWDFFLRLVNTGTTVHIIPKYFLHYRIRESSISINQSAPNREKIMDYMMEKNKEIYWNNLKKAALHKNIIDISNKESIRILLKQLYWKLTKKTN
jgi:glycosyltransferase involved in cell wall biosynthesis